MANHNTRADVIRTHNQTEITRKLNRAHTLAFFLRLELIQEDYGSTPLWLPPALDYIAGDLQDVCQLLKKQSQP